MNGVEALDAYEKLLRMGRAASAQVEPRLAAARLTLTQFGVLKAVLQEGALSQSELSRRVLTSAGNMTDLIGKLEARGLVRRARQNSDRRAVLVELTRTGRELIEPLYADYAADVSVAMAGLSSDDLRLLGDLLRKLESAVAA